MKTGPEIVPCPFCGGKGCYVDDGHYGFVECDTCGAKSGGYVFDDTATSRENRNSTIELMWNKRVEPKKRKAQP